VEQVAINTSRNDRQIACCACGGHRV